MSPRSKERPLLPGTMSPRLQERRTISPRLKESPLLPGTMSPRSKERSLLPGTISPRLQERHLLPGTLSVPVPAATVMRNQRLSLRPQRLSYVPAPVPAAAPSSLVIPMPPSAAPSSLVIPMPIKLTKGMPDTPAIKSREVAAGTAVDTELKSRSDAVIQEAKIKKQMLEQNAQLRLEEQRLEMEASLRVAHMNIDKEAQRQLMSLQEQTITSKAIADEKAAIAFAEQQKMKAMAEMAAKSQKIRKDFHEAEMALSARYQQMKGAGMNSGGSAKMPGMLVPAPVITVSPSYVSSLQATPRTPRSTTDYVTTSSVSSYAKRFSKDDPASPLWLPQSQRVSYVPPAA